MRCTDTLSAACALEPGAQTDRHNAVAAIHAADREGLTPFHKCGSQTSLPRTPALKRLRRMTAFTTSSKLPVVHVILLMTRDALRRKLHFRCGLAMAVGTLELRVGTKQSKAGLLEMIVLPQCPTVGAVATVAFRTQSPFVHVVVLMAIDAPGFGFAEGLRAVALGATHYIM